MRSILYAAFYVHLFYAHFLCTAFYAQRAQCVQCIGSGFQIPAGMIEGVRRTIPQNNYVLQGSRIALG